MTTTSERLSNKQSDYANFINKSIQTININRGGARLQEPSHHKRLRHRAMQPLSTPPQQQKLVSKVTIPRQGYCFFHPYRTTLPFTQSQIFKNQKRKCSRFMNICMKRVQTRSGLISFNRISLLP